MTKTVNKVSVQGFEDYLRNVFWSDNPEILDDDLPEAFDDYLSQVDYLDIYNDARQYCCSMGEFSADTAINIGKKFIKQTYGAV